jgi:hypothetical protein
MSTVQVREDEVDKDVNKFSGAPGRGLLVARQRQRIENIRKR